jgi:hypothetical protein
VWVFVRIYRTMKARLIAGLLASVLVFAVSTADAAPRRRGAKHPTKPAAATTADSAATKGAVLREGKPKRKAGAKRRPKAPKEAAKLGATRPASLMTPESESAARAAKTAGRFETPAVATAEKQASSRPAKAAAAPGQSRFVASGVPLAEVRQGRLERVGSGRLPCGTKSRWAKAKSRWQALDAWGRVTGTLTVGGSERYDATGCHQIWFSEGTGQDGRGVFVAEGSGYTAGASAEWKVDEGQKKRFDRLYAAQQGVWVEGKAEAAAEGRRTLFFTLPAHEAAAEGAPTQRRPARWAVSGGRVLVVGYVGANGAWKVGHVLPPNGKQNAYEPLAVLDMNGDGLPEIVVHEEAGGVFTDRVLSFDPASMRWETAIDGPGGASR